MAKNDGGQVFPIPVGPEGPAFLGITRRQLYAGLAMQGDMGNEDQGCWPNDATDHVIHARARLYWRMADALLATEEE